MLKLDKRMTQGGIKMKIVFSDIDGTFHQMGAEISQINLDAIDAMHQQGDRFVFVSGRSCTQIEKMQEELGKEGDIIFGNGAGFKLVGQPAQYENCLSLETCVNIMKFLDQENIFYHIHTSEEVYLKPVQYFTKHFKELRKTFLPMGEQGQQIMDFKENYFTNDCVHHEDLGTFFKENPQIKLLKIEVMESDEAKTTKIVEMLANENVYAFSSFFTGLEIVNPSSNKGSAINQYMKLFPDATSYGIGDAENDLPMLEVVDIAVAVDNATEIVKEACQEFTLDCLNGGVGHYIYEKIIV